MLKGFPGVLETPTEFVSSKQSPGQCVKVFANSKSAQILQSGLVITMVDLYECAQSLLIPLI